MTNAAPQWVGKGRHSAIVQVGKTVQDLMSAMDDADAQANPEWIEHMAYRAQRSITYHWCRAMIKFTKGVK